MLSVIKEYVKYKGKLGREIGTIKEKQQEALELKIYNI